MAHFKQLSIENDPLYEIIKSAFNTDIPVDGSWGYTKESATIITSNKIPYIQLEHMFASMRAHIEMNLTQKENKRYASINVKELSRETINQNSNTYHKINYEITGMKESAYMQFIQEYKENYGKKSFDLTKHFQERKEATLRREVVHWFKVS